MQKSLPNPKGPVFQLTPELLAKGHRASRKSPRLRIILPVQRSQEARVQRLLNFMQPGTYIHPHCHPQAHATESIYLISGELEILIFSPEGEIRNRHRLTKEMPLIDIEPDTWHSMVIHQPDTVVFEVKQGPYQEQTDKQFAPWAPAEGENGSELYLASISHDQ